MASSVGGELRPSRTNLALGLTFLALLAMGVVLRNGWVQDDTGIIQHNPMVQSLDGLWRSFAHPYWPGGERNELYRPLSISLFTLQWAAAGGAPWVFRVVNLTAYLAAVLALWALLRRIAPAPAAWLGAALFAVHPVHVEAVAEAVNQEETMVAAILLLCSVLYLDWRRGERSGRSTFATILALYLPALFIKEHAIILPGFFVALELTALRDGPPWRERLRAVAPLYFTLVVLAGLFWMLRGAIIGPGSGTAPQEVLIGLSLPGRAITMLGVVPEWLRLLFWPAHLQMEWSPLEYVPYMGWTLRETLGAVGLGSMLLALGVSWGRRPRITLALLWFAVAIFPVSNLAIPTGVIIAERTLFLASVGIALVATDLAAWIEERGWTRARLARLPYLLVITLLLSAGIIASATRMVTWKNRLLFLSSAIHDAPLSWRAHLAFGTMAFEAGDTAAGQAAIDRAVALHFSDIGPFLKIARQLQRQDGDCLTASAIYGNVIRLMPGRGDVVVGYMACATWLGRYATAATVAQEGIARGQDVDYLRKSLAVIDSANAAHAPPGTVRLPPIAGSWVDIGGLFATTQTQTR